MNINLRPPRGLIRIRTKIGGGQAGDQGCALVGLLAVEGWHCSRFSQTEVALLALPSLRGECYGDECFLNVTSVVTTSP